MSWAGALVDEKDGVKWTGAANSDTTPDFTLLGGRYDLSGFSSGTFSATLNVKTVGGHYVAAGSAVTTSAVFDLAAGTYQIVFGAAAGTAEGALVRVPYRAA